MVGLCAVVGDDNGAPTSSAWHNITRHLSIVPVAPPPFAPEPITTFITSGSTDNEDTDHQQTVPHPGILRQWMRNCLMRSSTEMGDDSTNISAIRERFIAAYTRLCAALVRCIRITTTATATITSTMDNDNESTIRTAMESFFNPAVLSRHVVEDRFLPHLRRDTSQPIVVIDSTKLHAMAWDPHLRAFLGMAPEAPGIPALTESQRNSCQRMVPRDVLLTSVSLGEARRVLGHRFYVPLMRKALSRQHPGIREAARLGRDGAFLGKWVTTSADEAVIARVVELTMATHFVDFREMVAGRGDGDWDAGALVQSLCTYIAPPTDPTNPPLWTIIERLSSRGEDTNVGLMSRKARRRHFFAAAVAGAVTAAVTGAVAVAAKETRQLQLSWISFPPPATRNVRSCRRWLMNALTAFQQEPECLSLALELLSYAVDEICVSRQVFPPKSRRPIGTQVPSLTTEPRIATSARPSRAFAKHLHEIMFNKYAYAKCRVVVIVPDDIVIAPSSTTASSSSSNTTTTTTTASSTSSSSSWNPISCVSVTAFYGGAYTFPLVPDDIGGDTTYIVIDTRADGELDTTPIPATMNNDKVSWVMYHVRNSRILTQSSNITALDLVNEFLLILGKDAKPANHHPSHRIVTLLRQMMARVGKSPPTVPRQRGRKNNDEDEDECAVDEFDVDQDDITTEAVEEQQSNVDVTETRSNINNNDDDGDDDEEGEIVQEEDDVEGVWGDTAATTTTTTATAPEELWDQWHIVRELLQTSHEPTAAGVVHDIDSWLSSSSTTPTPTYHQALLARWKASRKIEGMMLDCRHVSMRQAGGGGDEEPRVHQERRVGMHGRGTYHAHLVLLYQHFFSTTDPRRRQSTQQQGSSSSSTIGLPSSSPIDESMASALLKNMEFTCPTWTLGVAAMIASLVGENGTVTITCGTNVPGTTPSTTMWTRPSVPDDAGTISLFAQLRMGATCEFKVTTLVVDDDTRPVNPNILVRVTALNAVHEHPRGVSSVEWIHDAITKTIDGRTGRGFVSSLAENIGVGAMHVAYHVWREETFFCRPYRARSVTTTTSLDADVIKLSTGFPAYTLIRCPYVGMTTFLDMGMTPRELLLGYQPGVPSSSSSFASSAAASASASSSSTAPVPASGATTSTSTTTSTIRKPKQPQAAPPPALSVVIDGNHRQDVTTVQQLITALDVIRAEKQQQMHTIKVLSPSSTSITIKSTGLPSALQSLPPSVTIVFGFYHADLASLSHALIVRKPQTQTDDHQVPSAGGGGQARKKRVVEMPPSTSSSSAPPPPPPPAIQVKKRPLPTTTTTTTPPSSNSPPPPTTTMATTKLFVINPLGREIEINLATLHDPEATYDQLKLGAVSGYTMQGDRVHFISEMYIKSSVRKMSLTQALDEGQYVDAPLPARFRQYIRDAFHAWHVHHIITMAVYELAESELVSLTHDNQLVEFLLQNINVHDVLVDLAKVAWGYDVSRANTSLPGTGNELFPRVVNLLTMVRKNFRDAKLPVAATEGRNSGDETIQIPPRAPELFNAEVWPRIVKFHGTPTRVTQHMYEALRATRTNPTTRAFTVTDAHLLRTIMQVLDQGFVAVHNENQMKALRHAIEYLMTVKEEESKSKSCETPATTGTRQPPKVDTHIMAMARTLLSLKLSTQGGGIVKLWKSVLAMSLPPPCVPIILDVVFRPSSTTIDECGRWLVGAFGEPVRSMYVNTRHRGGSTRQAAANVRQMTQAISHDEASKSQQKKEQECHRVVCSVAILSRLQTFLLTLRPDVVYGANDMKHALDAVLQENNEYDNVEDEDVQIGHGFSFGGDLDDDGDVGFSMNDAEMEILGERVTNEWRGRFIKIMPRRRPGREGFVYQNDAVNTIIPKLLALHAAETDQASKLAMGRWFTRVLGMENTPNTTAKVNPVTWGGGENGKQKTLLHALFYGGRTAPQALSRGNKYGVDGAGGRVPGVSVRCDGITSHIQSGRIIYVDRYVTDEGGKPITVRNTGVFHQAIAICACGKSTPGVYDSAALANHVNVKKVSPHLRRVKSSTKLFPVTKPIFTASGVMCTYGRGTVLSDSSLKHTAQMPYARAATKNFLSTTVVAGVDPGVHTPVFASVLRVGEGGAGLEDYTVSFRVSKSQLEQRMGINATRQREWSKGWRNHTHGVTMALAKELAVFPAADRNTTVEEMSGRLLMQGVARSCLAVCQVTRKALRNRLHDWHARRNGLRAAAVDLVMKCVLSSRCLESTTLNDDNDVPWLNLCMFWGDGCTETHRGVGTAYNQVIMREIVKRPVFVVRDGTTGTVACRVRVMIVLKREWGSSRNCAMCRRRESYVVHPVAPRRTRRGKIVNGETRGFSVCPTCGRCQSRDGAASAVMAMDAIQRLCNFGVGYSAYTPVASKDKVKAYRKEARAEGIDIPAWVGGKNEKDDRVEEFLQWRGLSRVWENDGGLRAYDAGKWTRGEAGKRSRMRRKRAPDKPPWDDVAGLSSSSSSSSSNGVGTCTFAIFHIRLLLAPAGFFHTIHRARRRDCGGLSH
jgi:hypothetical protein